MESSMSARVIIRSMLWTLAQERYCGATRQETSLTLRRQLLTMWCTLARMTIDCTRWMPGQVKSTGTTSLVVLLIRRQSWPKESSTSAHRITRSMLLALRQARSSGATPQGAALSPHPRWPMGSSTLAPTIITCVRSTRYYLSRQTLRFAQGDKLQARISRDISRQEKIVKLHSGGKH